MLNRIHFEPVNTPVTPRDIRPNETPDEWVARVGLPAQEPRT